MKIDLLNHTFTLIGRVGLEGPQTQNVHRPITLAGADNLFFSSPSSPPSVTWEFMLILVSWGK